MISVYGSTGFIGGSFCNLFADDVIKIDRDFRKPQSKNILYFISTTTNYNVFEDLHLDINTNLNILMEVLQYCKDEEITFNYISSGFVYGLNILNAKETDTPDPRGFYSITKRTAEQLIISFCETFKCKYRILRLSNVYGTDKTISSKKNVLGFLINRLKEDKDVSLYEGGMVLRDYMHVDDVSRAIRCVIDKGQLNQIYNIGSGHPLYFYDIIKMAFDMIPNCKSKITSVETPEFYSKTQAENFFLNCEKLNKLNFQVTTPLNIGIKKLCTN